jgi:hypothetical protein
MNICGPIKDILLILSSSLIFQSPVTSLQWLGFSISLIGIALYRSYKIDPRFYMTWFQLLLGNFNIYTKQLFGLFEVNRNKTSAEERELALAPLLHSNLTDHIESNPSNSA